MEGIVFSLMNEFGFTPQDIVISILLFMNYRANKQIFTSLCNRVLVLETVTGVNDKNKEVKHG